MDHRRRLRVPLLLAGTLLVGGIAATALYVMSNSQLRTGVGESRCPTPEQKKIAEANDALGRYAPRENTTRPVTLTPMLGSETLKYDFLRARAQTNNVLSFSLPESSPVTANELQVAFVGNLVRADNRAIFPIAKYAPSQAYIVPWVRPDGRAVEFHVCIDPLQPSEPAPGRYSGTIAWSTREINTAGQPLVSPGQAPVAITLQYRFQYWVWLWGLLAIVAGVAIKLVNDGQARSGRGTAAGGGGDGGEPADGGAGTMIQSAAHRVGQSPLSLMISVSVAVVVGSGALLKGYYGNPEFAADLGGDLLTLLAAVFAATVAAHASVGALQTRP
jgi:hypothetical protein